MVGHALLTRANHPRTAAWYARLDKPGYTSPGPLFGGGWSVIQLALSYGGFRLMRAKRTSKRDSALALWALNNLLIAGWSGLFFGGKALGPSAVASGGMIATAAAMPPSQRKPTEPPRRRPRR